MERVDVAPVLDIAPDGAEVLDTGPPSAQDRLAAALQRIDAAGGLRLTTAARPSRQRSPDNDAEIANESRSGKRRRRRKRKRDSAGGGDRHLKAAANGLGRDLEVGSGEDDVDDGGPAKPDPYAKEEITVAIDVLTRLLGPQQAPAPAGPSSSLAGPRRQGTAPPAPPAPPAPLPQPPQQLLRLDRMQILPPPGPVRLIETAHDALAAKTEHLLEISNRLSAASRRLETAHLRENSFYDVALRLRSQGWILQARDSGSTGFVIDYGLRN
ncbi:hypothetical protein HK405_005642, partial [Cladochytrium tenue]